MKTRLLLPQDRVRMMPIPIENDTEWECASKTATILRELTAQVAIMNGYLERIASAQEGIERRK